MVTILLIILGLSLITLFIILGPIAISIIADEISDKEEKHKE